MAEIGVVTFRPGVFVARTGMENALITLAVGLSPAETVSHRIFVRYAKRHGMAFEVFDQEVFKLRPNWFRKRRVGYHLEKFQLHGAFERYRRILFLDSDILLAPDCPNLFDLVPEESFGCVYDDTGADAWKRKEELIRLGARLGRLPSGNPRYFNSGVMVLGPRHREVFAMRRGEVFRGRWPEQTLLNHRILTGGYAVRELPAEYNFMPLAPDWEDDGTRRAAKVVHYAGRGTRKTMARDYAVLAKEWGVEEPD